MAEKNSQLRPHWCCRGCKGLVLLDLEEKGEPLGTGAATPNPGAGRELGAKPCELLNAGVKQWFQ